MFTCSEWYKMSTRMMKSCYLCWWEETTCSIIKVRQTSTPKMPFFCVHLHIRQVYIFSWGATLMDLIGIMFLNRFLWRVIACSCLWKLAGLHACVNVGMCTLQCLWLANEYREYQLGWKTTWKTALFIFRLKSVKDVGGQRMWWGGQIVKGVLSICRTLQYLYGNKV